MHETRQMSYIAAVNAGIDWALANDDSVFVFGEDIALPNGPFGATKGLHAKYGNRVFDTPISETAMVGAALGAAMRGNRPILEIMYQDFMLVAMDQIVNQVASTRYTSAGQWGAPLVIRTQAGHSPGACSQHSHSLEAFFAHTPGLRVVMPVTPQQAYDAIRTATVSDDPVLVIENRMLYPTKGEVNLNGPIPSPGGTHRILQGDDVTVVAWSRTAAQALEAAELAASNGVSCDVLQLEWLSPLDLEPVFESVKRTGRAIVAHEANLTGGFGAEIVARIQQECFGALTIPVQRVGTCDVPVPAAPALQEAAIPGPDSIHQAIRSSAAALAAR